MARKILPLTNLLVLIAFLPQHAESTEKDSRPTLSFKEIVTPSKSFSTTAGGVRLSDPAVVYEGYPRRLLLALSDLRVENSESSNTFISRHLLTDNTNTTKKNSSHQIVSLNLAERTAFTVGYGVCFLLGFVGNFLILTAIASSKELQSDLNYLLFNAALADVLRTLSLISYELFVIHAIGNTLEFVPALAGVRGDILCKVMWCFPSLFIYVFVFTLVCMTFERFVAIVIPFRAAVFKGKSKWLIAGVWLAALVLSLPLLYATKSIPRDDGCICETDFTPFTSSSYASQWDMYKNVITAHLYLAYVIPLLIVLLLHGAMACALSKRNTSTLTQSHLTRTTSSSSSSSRDVVAMLGVVSLVFALTSLPNQVYGFLYVYDNQWNPPVYFSFLLLFIAELSSVFNPWLYPLFVKRFRRRYFKLLAKCVRLNAGTKDRSPSNAADQRTRLTNTSTTTQQTSL